jgi:DNA invertase Pin-like site-specific DNA recombinase
MSSTDGVTDPAFNEALMQMHKWVLGKLPDDGATRKTWIAYVRKSVNDDRDNVSLADQEGVIRAWATKMDHQLHGVLFSDVLSGVYDLGEGPRRRPGLARAMECLVDSKHCGLVVYRLDRLSRSTFLTLKLLNSLESRKKNFASASEDHLCFGPIFEPEKEMRSRMMLLFHCIMAEVERYNARIRTKAACQQKASRGIGQSRYSPHGTRFRIQSDAGIIDSHDSTTLKSNGAQSQLRLVPHEAEITQMKCLIQFTAIQIATRNVWSTGGSMLQHLQHCDLDADHRNGGKLLNASN